MLARRFELRRAPARPVPEQVRDHRLNRLPASSTAQPVQCVVRDSARTDARPPGAATRADRARRKPRAHCAASAVFVPLAAHEPDARGRVGHERVHARRGATRDIGAVALDDAIRARPRSHRRARHRPPQGARRVLPRGRRRRCGRQVGWSHREERAIKRRPSIRRPAGRVGGSRAASVGAHGVAVAPVAQRSPPPPGAGAPDGTRAQPTAAKPEHVGVRAVGCVERGDDGRASGVEHSRAGLRSREAAAKDVAVIVRHSNSGPESRGNGRAGCCLGMPRNTTSAASFCAAAGCRCLRLGSRADSPITKAIPGRDDKRRQEQLKVLRPAAGSTGNARGGVRQPHTSNTGTRRPRCHVNLVWCRAGDRNAECPRHVGLNLGASVRPTRFAR